MNRQLVIVRQFFDEAKRAPSSQTPFVRMRRTLDLDLSVELALGAVAMDHGTPEAQAKMAKRDLPWPDLWQAADEAAQAKAQKGLPCGRELRTLHEQRNLAQHRGAVPSAEDIAGMVEPVRELLSFVCREFYQRDFERLEHWDALECEPLRNLLTECLAALDRDEHQTTMRKLADAYNAIVRNVQLHVAGRLAPPTMTQRLSFENRELVRAMNSMAEVLLQAQQNLIRGMLAIEAEVMAVGLGLPMADHIRFVRHANGHVADAPADADFMLHYLAKAAVMLESALPGILNGLDLRSL
ncbi:MAG: hypothetical protein AB7I09_19850 [Planctomycetota bacterium]